MLKNNFQVSEAGGGEVFRLHPWMRHCNSNKDYLYRNNAVGFEIASLLTPRNDKRKAARTIRRRRNSQKPAIPFQTLQQTNY